MSCIEKYFIKGSTCPVTTLLRPERSQDFFVFSMLFPQHGSALQCILEELPVRAHAL